MMYCNNGRKTKKIKNRILLDRTWEPPPQLIHFATPSIWGNGHAMKLRGFEIAIMIGNFGCMGRTIAMFGCAIILVGCKR